ncbi:MAG TPA: acetyl-CoA carboxylase biotin carboxyl carrier protein [Planctomycetota bacterium]|nr:acetyl-CoA carboxylase biotin carboxyl carrier protein [Planctomycetota bacterium]
MDLDEIKRILQLMEENKLVEFEYEDEGRRLKLRRAEDRPVHAPVSIALPAPVAATAASDAAAAAASAEAARPANVAEFKSPLVGTFYRSSKPDSDAFVNVGDKIGPEKVLCIIEAMKVMNEIKAEIGGTVREILVKNGQAVEFGEPLFLIEKE